MATKHQFARLITSAFVHLSLTHILLNMVALGFIGPFLERAMGWWRYLATYLLAAFGGSLLVYAIGAHFGAVAGASGRSTACSPPRSCWAGACSWTCVRCW